MKTVAIAQARMGSTRVPGKVMRDLHGVPVLQWVVNAIRLAPGIDEVVIATSTLEADDVIAEYCQKRQIECFRGSETDVLERFYLCAKKYKADVVLRLTCDCPLLDPAVIGEVVRLRKMTNADYASNVSPPTYPDGLDVEVFTWNALADAWSRAVRPSDRDTVTQYISRNRAIFKVVNAVCPLPGLHKERWVLDTEDDWKFIEAVTHHMILEPDSRLRQFDVTTYLKVLEILDRHPELRDFNKDGVRNERFYAALGAENHGNHTFSRSQSSLSRAMRTIPFGAQTFSKSYLQFPKGSCPLYATHGSGSRIYDVDGNDYIDLVGAILPVVLGYCDPDVDAAIRAQLNQGISFSLATPLEAELSEMLVDIIPCAEMVKFGKTGTDVTSAAIRVARAATGRNHIALTGYHGWADWSMAVTDRNKGIPAPVKMLTRRFPYGDLEALEDLTTDYAAIIVEPNDNPTYLKALRKKCSEKGIVLIFDEVITGFRYAMGGAQEMFRVTPDLACFGKAMANGMPISALVGKRSLMMNMQPPNNIFYSGTMFGETLSIAAAIATIEKMQREKVIDHLWKVGAEMSAYANMAINDSKMSEFMRMGGLFPRRTIEFKGRDANKVRTLFLQSMAEHGVLIINSHNVSFAHTDADAAIVAAAYQQTCQLLRCAIDNGIDDMIDDVVEAAPLRATS